jgi:hypothetical protein
MDLKTTNRDMLIARMIAKMNKIKTPNSRLQPSFACLNALSVKMQSGAAIKRSAMELTRRMKKRNRKRPLKQNNSAA